MARFARPYCATEPVRTVPFFNLYDDIQITGRISYALDQARGTELDGRIYAISHRAYPSPAFQPPGGDPRFFWSLQGFCPPTYYI